MTSVADWDFFLFYVKLFNYKDCRSYKIENKVWCYLTSLSHILFFLHQGRGTPKGGRGRGGRGGRGGHRGRGRQDSQAER